MSDLSVNSILDASGGATTTINGYTPTVSNMAGRNRIINGDMRIDQRNAGAAVTVVVKAFVVDRCWVEQNTGTGTITGQQSTLGNSSSLKVTATAAVTDLTTSKYVWGMNQTFEGQNIFDLNSKTVTLSFKVETNWTGNLAVTIRNGSQNRTYVVDVAVVSGTNNASITLTLEAATVTANNSSAGMMFSIGANNEDTYRTATTGSWLAGLFMTSTASTQWAKTLNNFINVTEVQLEEGSVATPFERRPIGVELALCERYCEKSYDVDVVPGTGLANGWLTLASPTAATACGGFNFKTKKRAVPTIVIYQGVSGAAGSVYRESVGTTVGVTAGRIGSNGVGLLTLAAGAVDQYNYHYLATAEL
jgi:hypothetical protein